MTSTAALSENGTIDVLAAYDTGPRVLEAAAVASPVVLGAFRVSRTTLARLECIASTSPDVAGVLYLYDVTPGIGASRLVAGSAVSFSGGLPETARNSQPIELVGGRIYQVRATATKATPTSADVFRVFSCAPGVL